MSKPSEWLPKTNKLFERWCFASPTPREILESFNGLETELADKDKQLAEARAEIERKDKLIERMRDALKAIDGIGREAGNARREDALRCFAIAAAVLAAEIQALAPTPGAALRQSGAG